MTFARPLVLPALLVAVTLTGCAHHGEGHGEGMHHSFDDAESWAARFDDPARDSWQKPDDVIKALALPPDAVVADLGAATGYFAVRFAKAVPKGHVYGVDIESAMVDYLKKRAEKEGLANLTAVLAAPDDAKLPAPVDLVLVVNTYHHIDARPAYFTRLAASMKPGARLAIIDYTPKSKMGPPAEFKLEPSAVKAELESGGWVQVAESLLPEQYFLVFQRK